MPDGYLKGGLRTGSFGCGFTHSFPFEIVPTGQAQAPVAVCTNGAWHSATGLAQAPLVNTVPAGQAQAPEPLGTIGAKHAATGFRHWPSR